MVYSNAVGPVSYTLQGPPWLLIQSETGVVQVWQTLLACSPCLLSSKHHAACTGKVRLGLIKLVLWLCQNMAEQVW